MNITVQKLINRTWTNDDLKYLIHSSHDTQLLNVLEFWNLYDYDVIDQPYASSIFFELHYDDTCLRTTRDTSCFTVEAYNNGLPVRFDTCI